MWCHGLAGPSLQSGGVPSEDFEVVVALLIYNASKHSECMECVYDNWETLEPFLLEGKFEINNNQ